MCYIVLSLFRTGLFSATQTKELKELARAGLRNPVGVTVQVTRKPAAVAAADGSITAIAAAALEAGEGPKK